MLNANDYYLCHYLYLFAKLASHERGNITTGSPMRTISVARTVPRSVALLYVCGFLGALAVCGASPARAAALPEFHIAIKNHQFDPAELTIPAGKRVKLIVSNEDPAPAEFESDDFNAEKVVPGDTRIPVLIGPLPAGTYKFYDDFHEDTTGRLVVK